MQDKKLHKLGKTDLLTIIYEQQKEIESLKGSVKELENQLADRTIKMKEAGSIADASLKLNKIFEAAQEAADQYLNSIKAVNSLDSKGYAESVTKDEIQKDTYVEEVNVETIVEENNLEETKSDVEEEENSPNMYLIPLNRDLTIVKPKLLERMKIFFVNVMKLVLIFFHTLGRTTKTVLKTIFLKTIFVLKQLGKGIVKLLKWLKNVIVKLFKFLKSKICLKQMVLGIGKGIKKVFLKILAFFKLIKTKLSGLFQKKKETKKEKKAKPGKNLDIYNFNLSVEEIGEELNQRKKQDGKKRFLRTFSFACLVVIAVAIITATSFFKVLQVNGSSMEPSLKDGELLITSKFFDYEKGDMIAFYYNDKVLIKRVIATEGDTVYMDDDGAIYVNNEKLEEDYVKELDYGKCNITFPLIVPNESVFILGDNRKTSLDSRNSSIGCIKKDNIIGKIKLRLKPFAVY